MDYQRVTRGTDLSAEEQRGQPPGRLHVLGDEGDLEAARPGGEGGERDDLVAGVPVDGGTAVHLLEQLACHAGADAFGWAVWRPAWPAPSRVPPMKSANSANAAPARAAVPSLRSSI